MLDGVRMLPDDRREALIMRFALGMDNREIARALGRSDGATKVLIHRAIKQLEEIVSDPVPARRRALALRRLPRRRASVTDPASSFESLLREALAPVEPPAALALRLEETLTSITEMAADELEAWELGAMRDPRNWVRPAAAVVVGRRGRRRPGAAARPPPRPGEPARPVLRPLGRRTVRCATCPSRHAGCSARRGI